MRTPNVDTRRLVGRGPKHDDVESVAHLLANPEVAAALWPGALGGPRSAHQSAAILREDIEHWRAHRFGPWLFFERDSARFVGRGGLHRTEAGGAEVTEILYAVEPALWGKGYATEIAVAAIEAARQLGLERLVGFTLSTNLASQRVLEKAGLARSGEVEHAGLPHLLYELRLSG